MDFSLLGAAVPQSDASRMRARLLECLAGHFIPDRSGAIPIACRIEASEHADELQDGWFSGVNAVIVYVENDDLMIRATASAVPQFFKAREPWEDFDVCIFDEEMTWCVAVTHNDEVKRVSLR